MLEALKGLFAAGTPAKPATRGARPTSTSFNNETTNSQDGDAAMHAAEEDAGEMNDDVEEQVDELDSEEGGMDAGAAAGNEEDVDQDNDDDAAAIAVSEDDSNGSSLQPIDSSIYRPGKKQRDNKDATSSSPRGGKKRANKRTHKVVAAASHASSEDEVSLSASPSPSDDEDDDEQEERPKKLLRNAPRVSQDLESQKPTVFRKICAPPPKKEKKLTKPARRRKNATGPMADPGEEDEVDELADAEEEEADATMANDDDDGRTDVGSSSDEEAELVHLTEADIAELEDPEMTAVFSKFRNGDLQRGPISVGDVVKLRPSGGADSWLAVVERIHSKKTSLKVGSGDTRNESNFVGIKLSWLYARADFDNLRPSNAAWKEPSKAMGPNERVKTEHTDWNHQSMILSKDPELVYVFDDAYPARPMYSEKASAHPLSLFSIESLQYITASIYSRPALEALPDRSRSIAPIAEKRRLPPYFFSVSALPTFDPLLPKEETSGKPKKLSGGKDGVAGIPYVRVGFSFAPLPEVDSDDSEDEEADGGASAKSRAVKGRGKKAKGKSAWKKPLEKVWPLKFQEHGTPTAPYNPRHVQHYSRSAQCWWDVSRLAKMRETFAVTREKSADQPPPFSLDLDAPTFDPAAASRAARIEKLGNLASDKIVRGGAYGLTVNVYLVKQAEELYPRVSASSSTVADVRDLEQMRELLNDAVAWREEVSRRVRGIQEGYRLAKEWRSVGEEELPEGHEWLCPETEEPI
ncbi:hypothetical protein JCM10908_005170 [Rhodotorula pacifica]|uniref:uncharacterized protein n=1 Tax=Rhodotorula pacifica TaxID=1495444 RepID=UPI003170B451